MLNNKQTNSLAMKTISNFLKDVGAMSASDAQLALNNLVAVAAQSVELVVDSNAALDMLDGVKVSAQMRQSMAPVNLCNTSPNVFMVAPTTVQ